MRKTLFTLFLALAASVGTLFAESGTCGANLTWDLTGGALTISGTGAMTDYTYSDHAPWYDNRSSITSVTIENGVTSIGNYAFYECTSLSSVTIPNSVTSIGSNAFAYCSSLTSVTIPNSVTSIGSYAFQSCYSLTSITIPNSVTNIEGYAFYNVNNVVYSGSATGSPWGAKSVNGYVDGYFVYSDASKTTLLACSAVATGEIVIPNSVTSIRNSAFHFCRSLTSVTIPNSVTSIGNSPFRYCSSLTSIDVASDNPNYCSVDGVLFNKDKTKLIQYPIGNARTEYTIPNSVTSIGVSVFAGCSSLTSVTIPNSVTSFGNEVFYSCSGLTSVTIGNSVTSIGKYAFIYCGSLTSVTIPNSVTSIGSYAFYGCYGLTSITCKATTPPTCGDYALNNVSKTIPVYVPAASVDDYKAADQWKDFGENIQAMIPNTCGENLTWDLTGGVLTISGTGAMTDYTFSSPAPWYDNRESITSVIIENGVTSIGELAFLSCSSLTSVTIPNSVTSIGIYAFYGCSSLTSITIPSGVKSIGRYAFSSCTSLTSVTIGNSVASIGDYAFDYCIGLTSVTIGNSVTSIGSGAFGSCTSLVSVTIPNSVTSIGESAFNGCSNLTSLTIGNGVTSIGSFAFLGCSSLTSITCEATTPPTCGDYAFDNVPKTIPVYVPAASVDDYKAADWWKDFGENIQAIPSQTKTKSMTPGIVYLKWIEAKNQWGATVYDDQFNPGFVFSLVWAGNKTDIPTTIKYTLEKEDDNNVFAEVGNENYGGYAKNVDLVITTDGKGLRTKEEGGSTVLYIRAKISGEISSAEGDKMIVNAPADFIDVQIEGIDIPNALDQITNDQSPITNKIIKDNQIFILRGEKAFTLTGQEIK